MESIRGGLWERALELIPSIISPHSYEEKLLKALKIIRRQMFLEALEAGSPAKALELLRDITNGLESDPDHYLEIQNMASLLLCSDRKDLYQRAKWAGAHSERINLLLKFEELSDPRVLPRENHLAHLLEATVSPKGLTTESVLFSHASAHHGNLFTSDGFLQLGDEVWAIDISVEGRLAAGLKDGSMFIRAADGKIAKIPAHSRAISAVHFSPDGSNLLTLSQDCTVCIWGTENQEASLKSRLRCLWPAICGTWSDCGAVVSLENGDVIFAHDFEKLCTKQLNDMVFGLNSNLYVAAGKSVECSRNLSAFSTSLNWKIDLGENVTSLSLSSNGELLIADTATSIHMIRTQDGKNLGRIMTAPVRNNHVIQSCLVGEYLLRGNTDNGNINVWDLRTGTWCQELLGHEGPVNVLIWDPTLQQLISASDDSTLRFWKMKS